MIDDLSSTPVTSVTRQSHAYFGVINLIGGLAGPLSCQLCVTLRVNSSATRLDSTQLSCNTAGVTDLIFVNSASNTRYGKQATPLFHFKYHG